MRSIANAALISAFASSRYAVSTNEAKFVRLCRMDVADLMKGDSEDDDAGQYEGAGKITATPHIEPRNHGYCETEPEDLPIHGLR